MECKKCNKCNNEYPITNEYFFSDKSKKDGFTGICKTCKKNKEVFYLESDIGKIIDANDTCKVGIYKISNKINNKNYIGSTVNLYRRKNEHLTKLRKNTHYNAYLQNSFNKYEEENFEFTILDLVYDLTLLVEKEQYWMDFYESNVKEMGYNIRIKAESNVFLTMSEGSKNKCSIANKNREVSEETRQKLSIANTGKKHIKSEATREKLSIANKGKVFSKESKDKMSIARIEYLKNNPISEEEKLKRSNRMKGEKNPRYGKIVSEETILKYSKQVLQYDKDGNFINAFISVSKTKELGFDPSSVSKCCKGKLKQHKGYLWKYKDNQNPSL